MSRSNVVLFSLFAALAMPAAFVQTDALAAVVGTNGPNLLVNGGMDGKFVMQCSPRWGNPWVPVPCGSPIDYGTTFLWQTVQVPVGWTAWWQPPNEDADAPDFFAHHPNRCGRSAPNDCVPWHNPEYRDTAAAPQNPPRRLAGDNSLKYFTFYSVHEAGVYQTVGGVKPGQRLRFSVYMHTWASNRNDPYRSEGQQTMGLRVGIDPYGGHDPWSSNITWSPAGDAYDQWALFGVEAVAQSDHVTVFTRSTPVYPLQHNDVYVDEASLEIVR